MIISKTALSILSLVRVINVFDVFCIDQDVLKISFSCFVGVMCDMELNAQIQYVKILEDADVLMAYITSRMYSVTQQSFSDSENY